MSSTICAGIAKTLCYSDQYMTKISNKRQREIRPAQLWAKANPSLYTQCFTNQAASGEGWCSRCQGVDHSSANCLRPRSLMERGTYWKADRILYSRERKQKICQKQNWYSAILIKCHHSSS